MADRKNKIVIQWEIQRISKNRERKNFSRDGENLKNWNVHESIREKRKAREWNGVQILCFSRRTDHVGVVVKSMNSRFRKRLIPLTLSDFPLSGGLSGSNYFIVVFAFLSFTRYSMARVKCAESPFWCASSRPDHSDDRCEIEDISARLSNRY